MTAAPFDPDAYVADMRAVGVELIPYRIVSGPSAGRRVFSISGPAGVPYDVAAVATKWQAAALAHPDWLAAVHDALLARSVPA